MSKFVATFRVVFDEDSEVQAGVTMEALAIEMEQYMEIDSEDPESGDVTMTQLVNFGEPTKRTDLVNDLRRIRNVLIATKHSESFDVAKMMDMLAWRYEEMMSPAFELNPQYDHTHFLEIAQAVFQGKSPTD